MMYIYRLTGKLASPWIPHRRVCGTFSWDVGLLLKISSVANTSLWYFWNSFVSVLQDNHHKWRYKRGYKGSYLQHFTIRFLYVTCSWFGGQRDDVWCPLKDLCSLIQPPVSLNAFWYICGIFTEVFLWHRRKCVNLKTLFKKQVWDKGPRRGKTLTYFQVLVMIQGGKLKQFAKRCSNAPYRWEALKQVINISVKGWRRDRCTT